MDWQLVINRNREELLRIIVALIASLGLADGGRLTSLPYYLHRKALHIVRAAEAALRRLIVIAAQELAQRGFRARKPRVSFTNFMLLNPLSDDHVPAFTLIDPRKMFSQDAPEVGAFGPSYEEDSEPVDRTPIAAASLGRRLLALKKALDNIHHQAKRLTRWYAQRDAAYAQNLPHLISPLRPGTAPGWRRRKSDKIDGVLHECHIMAAYARRDSS